MKTEVDQQWVVMFENSYYWIEEYHRKVLNGFIFAIYGLYNYYHPTKYKETNSML
ncbi:MAG: D-glucuronyl C5-epimerase family protein [Thermoactinomyces vulgaris]|jgi:hypothetical protein|uniref:D-glucuronyl C5-epimerase C-terminal domain-containing protein n=1 Tax=Thermoactinomyces vulgaris TaxID=2026 RepID=A0ABS0QDX8_THEVU|nr:hypothetical protein [Thermoactinomyces vulgaris]MBA4595968.1 hypothetical protein [Thermoactinomyces vulgaris]MBH8587247.1 hypothetical protein [Thermoactinomyces vulgaris]QBK14129.1 hypothetical protein AB849_011300 [Thermoactinomyces vulgaris]QCV55513.1 hypothetical protein FA954_07760 [Thermoactinomyces vulgaris]